MWKKKKKNEVGNEGIYILFVLMYFGVVYLYVFIVWVVICDLLIGGFNLVSLKFDSLVL